MNTIMEISNDALALLSVKKAFELNVIPVKILNGALHLGISNKYDQKVINDLSFYTGLKIVPVEMPSDVILNKLKEVYDTSEMNITNGEDQKQDNAITDYSNVDFVNQVISNAIKTGASDIHFEGYETIYRVRYRIDGHLREILNLPKTRSLAIASRLKIMANLDISEKRRPQDGRIRFNYNSKTIDLRVSILPTNFGEKIVLRILDKSQVELDLTKLGLNSSQLEILSRNIKNPYGMILVTGPTGSGKTTSLYSILKTIHSVEKNILTIEDPIEYNLDGINQSSVRPEIGYDFANALRSFLRQDPDIIMVGEIRDKETAEIAIRASLTGHLVFSTLHTNDSISAITRLIDMGIEPFLVSSSVRIIVAQRLVRILCSCKVKSTKKVMGLEHHYDKKGCEKCSYTGYKGRRAIFELFEINNDLADMISKNSPYKEIKNKAIENGFLSLRDSGIEKILSGATTIEEVWRETML